MSLPPHLLWVGGLMSYLCYLCLLAYRDVQHILCCVFAFFVFVLCLVYQCCLFLWIVHFRLPLRYCLTFIETTCTYWLSVNIFSDTYLPCLFRLLLFRISITRITVTITMTTTKRTNDNSSWQRVAMFIWNRGWVRDGVIVLNNISGISWRLVLLVDETKGPGENHQPVACHWQTLSHNIVTPRPDGD
jgi:hypothetical protein